MSSKRLFPSLRKDFLGDRRKGRESGFPYLGGRRVFIILLGGGLSHYANLGKKGFFLKKGRKEVGGPRYGI